MGKYFGTDGVRGEANVELTPELALNQSQEYVLSSMKTGSIKFLWDVTFTYFQAENALESALVAGLLSVRFTSTSLVSLLAPQ